MAATSCIDALEWLRKPVEETAPDPLRAALTEIVNLLMAAANIKAWRRHCNEVRPHSSLGYFAPHEFTNQQEQSEPTHGGEVVF